MKSASAFIGVLGRTFAIYLLPGCLLCLANTTLPAQGVDIFMKVGGQPATMGAKQTPPTLPGNSVDLQYTNWISLAGVQMGVSRAISTAGGKQEAGAPSVSEVVVTKLIDNATPSLYSLACGGKASVAQPIDYVTIDFRKSGTTQTFYRMMLQDVYVSSVSTDGGTNSVPAESVSLNFQKISWSYDTYSDDKHGKVQTTSYDLRGGAGVSP